jgi:hypothetical protein
MAISCPQWQRASEAVEHGNNSSDFSDILKLSVIIVNFEIENCFYYRKIMASVKIKMGFPPDLFHAMTACEKKRGIMAG